MDLILLIEGKQRCLYCGVPLPEAGKSRILRLYLRTHIQEKKKQLTDAPDLLQEPKHLRRAQEAEHNGKREEGFVFSVYKMIDPELKRGPALAAQLGELLGAAQLGELLGAYLPGRGTPLTRYGQGLHYRQARLPSNHRVARLAPLHSFRPAATLFWLARG
ncbi:hypothetical protein BHE74_00027474 [Ensete ventricosum]|nr:hypothetical protein GW17_00043739 [Ensete ventricosum]RWW65231.1 hypothetical protein BHE74_00027474 [Ensete ventricosum]